MGFHGREIVDAAAGPLVECGYILFLSSLIKTSVCFNIVAGMHISGMLGYFLNGNLGQLTAVGPQNDFAVMKRHGVHFLIPLTVIGLVIYKLGLDIINEAYDVAHHRNDTIVGDPLNMINIK